MTEKDDLQTAINLVKADKKSEGGRILSGLVKTNPDNEQAWEWLSVCVVPEEQKRHCLKQVLRINPQNTFAKKMLESLDFKPVFDEPANDPPPNISALPVTDTQNNAKPSRNRRQSAEAFRNGQPVDNVQTKLCPFCKSPMSVKATVCPHCGKNSGTPELLSQLSCSIIQLVILIPIVVIIFICLWSYITTR